MSDRGRIVRVSERESLTGKLDEPLGKEDLDVFRTHLSHVCPEDEVRARDAVRAWRAGRAFREAVEAAVCKALGQAVSALRRKLRRRGGLVVKGPS